MKCDKHTMLLYAVTDRAWVGEQTLYQQVEKRPEGRCHLRTVAGKAAGGCRVFAGSHPDPRPVPAVRCATVHQRQRGRGREVPRRGHPCGPERHGRRQGARARGRGYDDRCFGPHGTGGTGRCGPRGRLSGRGAAFATHTKEDVNVLPRQTLIDICNAVDVPVVAIGGIHKDNILQLRGTGVDGVALVSAIFGAKDIEAECRELKALSEQIVE